MSLRTSPTDAETEVTVTADMQHLCPFVDEVDFGTIAITWQCDGATLELHSLREYLDGFKDSELSHEALTDLIRHDLSVIPGVDLASVTTTWQTAGMGVTCSTSPIRVGQP
jgi:NADPH-dependent 7-cyano-7-deazaguanine reductase QueF